MEVNMHVMSVPLFIHQFKLWQDILKKGENFSQKRKIDPLILVCLLYTSPSPRDVEESRMPSSA